MALETTVPQHLLSPDQAQIAEQDGGRFAEPARRAGQPALAMPAGELDVRRGTPSPRCRIIHDIVLQQRECVQQLQTGGRRQGRIAGRCATQPAQVHERRPQALAAFDKLHQNFPGRRRRRSRPTRRHSERQTNSATSASTARRKLRSPASNWSGHGRQAGNCRAASARRTPREFTHSSHRSPSPGSVSRWLERLRFTRWYPFDEKQTTGGRELPGGPTGHIPPLLHLFNH